MVDPDIPSVHAVKFTGLFVDLFNVITITAGRLALECAQFRESKYAKKVLDCGEILVLHLVQRMHSSCVNQSVSCNKIYFDALVRVICRYVETTVVSVRALQHGCFSVVHPSRRSNISGR